jgi:hypothetical protein
VQFIGSLTDYEQLKKITLLGVIELHSYNVFKLQGRDRVRKKSRRVEAKGLYGRDVRQTIFLEARKSILMLGVPQAMSTRPSLKDRMTAKTLGW